MTQVVDITENRISDGRGRLVEPTQFTHLAAGTMVTRDLVAARRLYEDFLGFEGVRYAPGRMLLRDRRAKYLMEQGERDFFVIDVREVESVNNPQRNLNHWGLAVHSPEEVDRIHAFAKAHMDAWWIRKVRPVTKLHGSHGFYLIDQDDNWWEVEYRNGMTNDLFFSNGDFDARIEDPALKVDPPLAIALTPSIVVGPDAFMTHGTTDLVSIAVSRPFYEEVLGLRSVHHVNVATFTAGGGDFAIVGVQAGKLTAHQEPTNRWVLLVEDEAALEAMRDRAIGARDHFGILGIGAIEDSEDGGRSFLLRSPDDNWFEVSTRSAQEYRDIFDRGDIA